MNLLHASIIPLLFLAAVFNRPVVMCNANMKAGTENIIPKFPLFCNTSVTPQIFQLNPSIDCKNLMSSTKSAANRRLKQNATIFKLNLLKYNTVSWSCQKIVRQVVIYRGLGQPKKLSDKTLALPMTVDECSTLNATKICKIGNELKMLYQTGDGVWTTNISSTMQANMFQTKAYNATNCFLTKGEVWINRFTNKMESTFGSVSQCPYLEGSCALHDSKIAVWLPHREARCTFLPWKNITGFVDNGEAFHASGDEPMVLTFGKIRLKFNDTCHNEFYQTEQGVGLMLHSPSSAQDSSATRRKRKKRTISAASESGYDPITQGEVNMKLQGLVHQLLNSPDVNGQSVSCAVAQEIAFGWHDELAINPTLVVRRILRNPNVKAELHGRAIFVWRCTPVDDFRILPMANVCTTLIPLVFNVSNSALESAESEYGSSRQQIFGYMHPFSNEIEPKARSVECSTVEPIILEINDTTYWYDHATGAHDVSDIPAFSTYSVRSLTESKNATNNLLSSVVYRAESMYSRKEYMHYIDVNELHRNVENEQDKKLVVENSLLKYKSVQMSPDLISGIGDIFKNFGSWWSYLYWFAVGVSGFFVIFGLIKLFCFCHNALACCSIANSSGSPLLRRRRRRNSSSRDNNNIVEYSGKKSSKKGAETFV